MTDYSHATFDDALPDAKRYCLKDGRAWIMKDKAGRYHVINPYAKSVEVHYLNTAGYTLEAEVKAEPVVYMKQLTTTLPVERF